MKRADDFEVRRQHIANLTDERSVLLRMGVSSLDCMPIVNHAIDNGLMGKGCGHCVYKLSKLENISIRDASIKLAKGEGWDKLVEAFKGGKK